MDNKDLGRSADADGLSQAEPASSLDGSANSIPSAEPDMSWFLIAVDRRHNCVVLDYASGWNEFDIEFHWEDTFDRKPPLHLTPGAYIFSGYEIGYWGEDSYIPLYGGEFTPFLASAIEARSGETVGLDPKGESAAPQADAQGGVS